MSDETEDERNGSKTDVDSDEEEQDEEDEDLQPIWDDFDSIYRCADCARELDHDTCPYCETVYVIDEVWLPYFLVRVCVNLCYYIRTF